MPIYKGSTTLKLRKDSLDSTGSESVGSVICVVVALNSFIVDHIVNRYLKYRNLHSREQHAKLQLTSLAILVMLLPTPDLLAPRLSVQCSFAPLELV